MASIVFWYKTDIVCYKTEIFENFRIFIVK